MRSVGYLCDGRSKEVREVKLGTMSGNSEQEAKQGRSLERNTCAGSVAVAYLTKTRRR
jgi:hypothetical protein